MYITLLKSKIHRATVTQSELNYVGSITIDKALMDAAGLLEYEKVVFEFQHSALSSSEFYERNSFYNALGYKVIWVFDAIEQYLNGQIDNYKRDLWSWNKYRSTRYCNSFFVVYYRGKEGHAVGLCGSLIAVAFALIGFVDPV